MKTSLKKLQKFAALRHDKRTQKHRQSLALDELARATQDMNDMKDCYDRLLSAAAATANSVYEFSESLREMGDCLLEKTALNDNEENGTKMIGIPILSSKATPYSSCAQSFGFNSSNKDFKLKLDLLSVVKILQESLLEGIDLWKVLLMLGKVQFELQKLVDGYRSHIFKTITNPSDSLLNELRVVEEMKKRCDEKREIYEELKKQKEKGRLRSNKGESYTSAQLQEVHNEYEEEANVFVFRMKSLKQGQSLSFLTQASRHHAAQLSFFKKAVRSLEAVEPHVRLLAEQHHIDYEFSGLKDDGREIYSDDVSDEDDDSEAGSGTYDGELSFDRGKYGPLEDFSASRNSMELPMLSNDAIHIGSQRKRPLCTIIRVDNSHPTSSPDPKRGAAQETVRSPVRNSFSFRREVRAISKSAPLFPEKRLDSAERVTQLGPSPSRKFTSYALPTPDEKRSPVSVKLYDEVPQTTKSPDLQNSSPLDKNRSEKLQANEKISGPVILDAQSVLKESNTTSKPSHSPSPLTEGLSLKQLDPTVASYAKKAKRQAFSGPLTGKPWPNNTNLSASGPIIASPLHPPFSGSLLRTPLPRPSSNPKLSSRTSPAHVSSPKISELHELPRPPAAHLASYRPPHRSAYSGPLISKTHDLSSRFISRTSTAASPLPIPPQALPRSFSIPAGGQMEVALHAPLEDSQNLKSSVGISSPPLTPISTQHVQAASSPSIHNSGDPKVT